MHYIIEYLIIRALLRPPLVYVVGAAILFTVARCSLRHAGVVE